MTISSESSDLNIYKWSAEYDRLRAAGWSWRQAAYIAWASSPVEGRSPSTLGKLARQVLGLKSARAIRKWRANNPEIDKAIFDAQAGPLMRYRRDVFEALATSARNADYRHSSDRRLFLTMTGDLVDRSEIDQTTTLTVDDATAEAMRKIYGGDDDD